ncbi:Uncharacterised protein [Vibrio cholerae]|uniref:Uncharacterized protein n=1 Tax=Vibrio cholerae TaxID=666 RepID=A0A655TGM2_VIBCL|nr:Uncharacterised protein [Vibrio cholerae]CSA31832.1 Uncharacterised protein [Vibrio cholerae]CSA44056.1 Uncharacterised protein [Vibrio cholerae]CSA59672.1 Uncharacterised protein [Vibrio cholerae]CSB01345.1 Uncharacterised protein [Vibrio cholerae]
MFGGEHQQLFQRHDGFARKTRIKPSTEIKLLEFGECVLINATFAITATVNRMVVTHNQYIVFGRLHIHFHPR